MGDNPSVHGSGPVPLVSFLCLAAPFARLRPSPPPAGLSGGTLFRAYRPRPAARALRGDAAGLRGFPRDVMDCHVLSCSSCGRCIGDNPSVHGSGPVPSIFLLRLAAPFARLRPSPPPARAAEPRFAHIARARPRALRGGAVRAPDCACAREGGAQDTLFRPAAGGPVRERPFPAPPVAPQPAAGRPVRRNPVSRVSPAPVRARYAAARSARPIAPARVRGPGAGHTLPPGCGRAGAGGAVACAPRSRPGPPPAGLCGGTLFRAIACARPRARYAATRPIAPARARAGRRTRSCARLRAGRGGRGRSLRPQLRPSPPPAGLCGGTLFRAYRLRPSAGALRGGAPDCACAREGGAQDTLLRPVAGGPGRERPFPVPPGCASPRRRPACAAEPCFARIACARPRALRGGAVCAPDCACAREGRAQDALLRLAAGGRGRSLRPPVAPRPAAGLLRAAEPCFARIACARPRARYAAARFARLIAPARARAGRRTHSSARLRAGRCGRGRSLRPRSRPSPLPAGLCGGTLFRAYRLRLSARVTRRRA